MNALRNIWADLVEKRLWPLALALIVGIGAVPVVLARGTDEPSAPTEPTAATSQEGELVALDTRDVVRRSREGRARNPFRQRALKRRSDEAQERPSGTTSASGGGEEKGGGSTDGGASTDTAKTEKPAGGKTKKPPLDTYTVNLRFGQAGAMRSLRDVARLTPLPSASDPFFVLLGVKSDGETVVFLVSSDATTTGDGTCKPSAANCETIEMQAGDTAFFDLTTEDGVRQYQLDVVSIRRGKAASAKEARAARRRASRAGTALLELAREETRDEESVLGPYRWDADRGVLVPLPPRQRADGAGR